MALQGCSQRDTKRRRPDRPGDAPAELAHVDAAEVVARVGLREALLLGVGDHL